MLQWLGWQTDSSAQPGGEINKPHDDCEKQNSINSNSLSRNAGNKTTMDAGILNVHPNIIDSTYACYMRPFFK
jgi:hypothetical protein